MGVFLCRSGERFTNVETDHACLGDLFDALRDDGMVIGSILHTRGSPTDRGVRHVLRRQAIIVTPRTFDSISDCTVRFVEEVD